ncbi:hypothetical protein RQP46_001428 [Phenoliferia psychrophenolica]
MNLFRALALCAAPALVLGHTGSFSFGATKYLFGFGNSYTTTGWNFSAGALSADPSHTASGGTNLAHSFNKSDILLRNFAYGGATIDSRFVVPYLSTVINLNQQLEEWYSLQEALYNSGARNFLHLAVPPTQRTPMFADEGRPTTVEVKSVVDDFNLQLRRFSDKLQSTHPDANVLYFDANVAFGEILDNAKNEGFKNWTQWCPSYNSATTPTALDPNCTYPLNEFFWLNNYHPTWPVHYLLAKKLYSELLAGTAHKRRSHQRFGRSL